MNTVSDNQLAFNVAFAGLKAQNFQQSHTTDGPCQYRGPDGLKCAVGHLIPDEHYDPAFDAPNSTFGNGISRRDDIFDAVLRQFPEVDRLLLIAMQDAHDSSDPGDEMRQAFIELAAEYDLEVHDA